MLMTWPRDIETQHRHETHRTEQHTALLYASVYLRMRIRMACEVKLL
jgi:hypothetical protein